MNKKLYWVFLILAILFGPSLAQTHESGPGNPLEGDMAFIPAGQFVFGTDKKDAAGDLLAMGVPKPLYLDEQPQQKVFLKGFYLDKNEVTNLRYKNFLDDLPNHPKFKTLTENLGSYAQPQDWENGTYLAGQANHPVVWVTWYDAANFCDWAGKRLPTEKEWERAARGTEGREYPWGQAFEPDRANLPDKAGAHKDLLPVGSFPRGATPSGVNDLAGNVWEWVNNDYAPYSGSSYTNADFDSGYKVLRGASQANIGHFPGDFYSKILKEFSRSGYRQYSAPENAAPDVGFRCVSSSQPLAMKLQSSSPGLDTGGRGNNAVLGSSNPFVQSAATSSENPTAIDPTFNPFEPESNLPNAGLLVLTILSFLAGLFSFLSPCTLPILPAYFAVTAQASRARMTINSLAFFCGLAALFVLMGGSASFLGSLLRDYLFSLTTWGGVLIAIFGVMTLFGKGFSGANFQSAPTTTLVGYFLFGATFALGWTPCIGPILSGILILAASDKTVLQGMALLFFFALGLGLPLIVFSAFFSHLKKDGWFWRLLRGKGWNLKLGNHHILLHSTNVFSGVLLIVLGVALAQGYLTYFNNLIPIEVQLWFSGFEETIVHWLT